MKTITNISKVLVIDDDDFLLKAIQKKLELSGYNVIVSNNIQDAYFKLNVMKPDFIMLDIIMPEMNGLEFMNSIKAQIGAQEIPVILMSYLSKNELYGMGYNIGNAHYLPKPFNVNELPVILRNIFLQENKINEFNN